MGLSAVIITYNEEENISRCLDSLSFADEIVVMDSFSSDKTLEIVRKYTDRIYQRQFTGFSEQWNAAFAKASHEWILKIDADEVVSPELRDQMVEALRNPQFDSYKMPRLSYFLDRPIKTCGWYPDPQLRLAKTKLATVPDRLVHERLVVNGTCGTLKGDLIHYTDPNLDRYSVKMLRYAKLAAQQKFDEGRRFHLSDLLITPGATFLKFYIVEHGIMDGMNGFVLCGLNAFSVFLRYCYLWEIERNQGKA